MGGGGGGGGRVIFTKSYVLVVVVDSIFSFQFNFALLLSVIMVILI